MVLETIAGFLIGFTVLVGAAYAGALLALRKFFNGDVRVPGPPRQTGRPPGSGPGNEG